MTRLMKKTCCIKKESKNNHGGQHISFSFNTWSYSEVKIQ